MTTNDNTFRIDKNCWFDFEYGTFSLNYIEHSPDSWYSDLETDITIDVDTAKRMIVFFQSVVERIENGKQD